MKMSQKSNERNEKQCEKKWHKINHQYNGAIRQKKREEEKAYVWLAIMKISKWKSMDAEKLLEKSAENRSQKKRKKQ